MSRQNAGIETVFPMLRQAQHEGDFCSRILSSTKDEGDGCSLILSLTKDEGLILNPSPRAPYLEPFILSLSKDEGRGTKGEG